MQSFFVRLSSYRKTFTALVAGSAAPYLFGLIRDEFVLRGFSVGWGRIGGPAMVGDALRWMASEPLQSMASAVLVYMLIAATLSARHGKRWLGSGQRLVQRGAPRLTFKESRGSGNRLQLTIVNGDDDGTFSAQLQITGTVASDLNYPTEFYEVPWAARANLGHKKWIHRGRAEDLLICEWATRTVDDVSVVEIRLQAVRGDKNPTTFHTVQIPQGDVMKRGEMVCLTVNVFCDGFEKPFSLEGNIHFQTGDASPTMSFGEP